MIIAVKQSFLTNKIDYGKYEFAVYGGFHHAERDAG